MFWWRIKTIKNRVKSDLMSGDDEYYKEIVGHYQAIKNDGWVLF